MKINKVDLIDAVYKVIYDIMDKKLTNKLTLICVMRVKVTPVKQMILGFVSFAFSASVPRWPPSWTIRGTWKVPYTNLSNHLEVVQEPTRQYINEHNGLLQIWNTDPSQRIHRKIVAAMNKTICFGYSEEKPWDIEFTQFLPDMTEFKQVDGIYIYSGKRCDLWRKTIAGGKTQTWEMYIEHTTGKPVAYKAHAISIYGSHYDIYVLEIDEFLPEAASGVWNMPSICTDPNIQDDPYPGAMYDLYFPRANVDKYVNQIHQKKSYNTTTQNRFSHMDKTHWLKTIKARSSSSVFEDDDDPLWDECYTFKGSKDFVAPKEFSWRDFPNVVTPPRDQVACGSCWAFGTAGLLESAFALKTGKLRPVSTNQIMDCTWDARNYGCQGGEIGPSLTSLKHSHVKIATEASYPYMGVSGYCNYEPEEYLGYVKDCFHVENTRAAVKEALYKFGPLGISINVIEDMVLYTNGVFDEEGCTGRSDDLIHIVQLTGWRVIDGKEAWEVKNSWSTHWGDEGYIYIQSEVQEKNCGVTSRAVGVVLE